MVVWFARFASRPHHITPSAPGGGVPLAIRALLLDHDGTLVDSYEGIARCMRLTCRDLGVPEMTEEEILASIGPTIEERFAELWGEDAAGEAAAIYRSHYEARGAAGVRVLPGVKKTLETLSRRGILMACVSNKAWFFCKGQLDRAGLLPFIQAVVGHRQGHPPKPAPDMLFAAMKALGARPEETLMIGDTATDVRAARNASIPAWIVKGRYARREEIRKSNPDRYLESLADLPRLL